jgi:hypothetical protein
MVVVKGSVLNRIYFCDTQGYIFRVIAVHDHEEERRGLNP